VNVMAQSEKGIRHLLNDYVSDKGISFVRTINEKGMINEDIPLNVFSLYSEFIDEIDAEVVSEQLGKLLSYHARSKRIEFREIENVAMSKYGVIILDILRYHECTIYNVPMKYSFLLDGMQFELESVDSPQEEKAYVPFDNCELHERDFNYIKVNEIPCLEVASYTGGWYWCLPYVSVYEIFDKNELRCKALKIIHTSLFARIKRLGMMGSWVTCLAAIPQLLEMADYDVDWNKLYNIFNTFLRLSLIDG